MASPPYPDPIFSHKLATATGTGLVIDIATADQSGYPPVIICKYVGDGSVAYKIEGSHDGTNFVDFTNGGFTDDVAKDLVPGVRFWRTNLSAVSGGNFTSSVGAMPTQEGTRAVNNVIVTTTPGPTV